MTPFSLQAAKAYCKLRPDHGLYKLPKDFSQSKKPLLGVHTIILMHADRSRLSRVFQPALVVFRAGRLVFAAGILLALLALLWWQLTWLAVVFLLLTLVAMLVAVGDKSVTTDEHAAAPDTIGHPNQTAFPLRGEAGQYWTDWLGGWYWQTDAQYRLTLLKPPQGSPPEAWAAAHDLASQSPCLWEVLPTGRDLCEPLVDDSGGPARKMLASQLIGGGQIRVDGLPWPMDGDQRRQSQMIGQPRLDESGRLLGHHGVWTPDKLAPAVPMPRAPVLTLIETSPEPRRTEEEINQAAQESLRFALSHDLRAPLRVVDGFARILKEDYAHAMDRIGKDHLERILSATVRMNGMIDAVLDQARLSQAPLQLVRVNLSAMVHDVATELMVGMKANEGEASAMARPMVVVAEELWHLADEVLVRRVLENLIGNALKYSAKVSQARIEFGAVPATNPTVFFVKDNGAGFDMKHADKLFGLFQRLHSAREFQGTGVGLASVQNIVRRHGGRVWAEGVPGEGACFYFTLASFGTAGAHPGAPAGQVAAG
jgi:signal transduction histidine kinase